MNANTVLVDVAVKDLSGAALDWAVGKAENYKPENWKLHDGKFGFSPSSDWSQGGPLIDKHQINLHRPQHSMDCWAAWVTIGEKDFIQGGPQPLLAVCRVVVASVLGDIVKVPACLVLP